MEGGEKLSPRDSSIGCEPRLMKRRSQVRISLPLPLRGHVKKKGGEEKFELVIFTL
jgi:hypothetical protein